MTEAAKLAVFDCDGTLVDSQHAITSCMRVAFETAGIAAPGIDAVRRVIGLPLRTAIDVLLDGRQAAVSELADTYAQTFGALRRDGNLMEPLFAGLKETLFHLHEKGWLLGVATGKSHRGLVATLRRHGLEGMFLTLQTSDRARGKPHPEMLHMAMDAAGTAPRDTVMIGDTTFDIEMARAADVRAIGVAWGYHAPEELVAAGAAAVVNSAAELADAIKNPRETD